jgi:hypothetical protein
MPIYERIKLLIEALIETFARMDLIDQALIILFILSSVLATYFLIKLRPWTLPFNIIAGSVLFITITSIIENLEFFQIATDELVLVHYYVLAQGIKEALLWYFTPAFHDVRVNITLIPTLLALYKTIEYLATEYKLQQLNLVKPQKTPQTTHKPQTQKTEKKPENQPTTPKQKTETQQPQPQQPKEPQEPKEHSPEEKKFGKLI